MHAINPASQLWGRYEPNSAILASVVDFDTELDERDTSTVQEIGNMYCLWVAIVESDNSLDADDAPDQPHGFDAAKEYAESNAEQGSWQKPNKSPIKS
jgi:hypothetical protein